MFDWLVQLLRPFSFRGKYRLLTALIPKQGQREACIFGVRSTLDLSDLIQRFIYLGCYEPLETAAVRKVLRPGMTFVDAGANIGYFTWLAARLVGPTGRVLAVEPSPALFASLARSVRDHGLSQVSLHPVGLSDAPGELNLYIPPEAKGNQSPSMVPVENWQPSPVPVATLDTLLDEQKIDRVDLLKLDVEGHEPRVLAGLGEWLRDGRVGAVLCEFNDYFLRESGSSPAALWQTLIEAGLTRAGTRADMPAFPPGVVESYLLQRRAKDQNS